MTSVYEVVKVRRFNGRREARWGNEAAWQVIDEGTGLPVVGEDQFWRVVPPGKGSKYMGVELHQKRPPKEKKTWWGRVMLVECASTIVGSAVVNVTDSDFTADSVLESALYVLRSIDEGMTKDDLVRKLAGDYPPKSLKDLK